ncbi:MAG: hypothetical protein R2834_12905 [Rhodothermales bacterium]
MDLALQKTLALVAMMGIGLLLRGKVNEPQLGGLKLLILSVALPATIFLALLKIDVGAGLWSLPLLAIGFNLFLLGATRLFISLAGIGVRSREARTLLLLAPSLAPGLSSFPYISEYLGNTPLAWAAIADVGNKAFVLIGLYLLALHWHGRWRASGRDASGIRRVRTLVRSLVSEPVNAAIVAGLMLAGFGVRLDSLPLFVQDVAGRLSGVMTPLILMFIGLAVRIDWHRARGIALLLFWRAGFSLLFAALLLTWLPIPSIELRLLAVVFSLSACSFWPFAHMSAIDAMEHGRPDVARTADTGLALGVLALSLPFSTLLVLGVCAAGDFFATSGHVLGAACICLAVACGPLAWRHLGILRAVKRSAPADAHVEPVSA